MSCRGTNDDITADVKKVFRNACVFADPCFYDLLEKLKGGKRTWLNPMSSKHWKSLYYTDNVAF